MIALAQSPFAAKPPDGNVSIEPVEPYAFWAVERALFPGESVKFTVAVAEEGSANGKSFALEGTPTVHFLDPDTLWLSADDNASDPNNPSFEALNNGDEPLEETVQVYAVWIEQIDPRAGDGEGGAPEPETIDGSGYGLAYTDRPNFTWNYPGTRMQFADGETVIDFTVTAAANGAALDMNLYDITGETAWVITDNPNGVNRIGGTVKSDSVGQGNRHE